MLPEFITFTGVDDHTDPLELLRLADDYPVEFGLLFSPKRQGIEPRYPKLSTIERLTEEFPLRWSAHLCGGDARAWLYEDRCEHDLRNFQRVQINTADPNVQPSMIGNQAAKRNLRAILQCRGDFPHVASVDVLFDASGGRGITPSAWPKASKTTFCGYAGGLRPENVAEAVHVIGRQGLRYWIDMESGVRDEDDLFSIDRCRAVCEAIYRTDALGVQPSLRLEVGKRYRTRNGATVLIAESGVGCFYGDFGPGNQRRRYGPEGGYCGHGATALDPWDIVAEADAFGVNETSDAARQQGNGGVER